MLRQLTIIRRMHTSCLQQPDMYMCVLVGREILHRLNHSRQQHNIYTYVASTDNNSANATIHHHTKY